MDDVPNRRGIDGERRRKRAFLDRDEAETDNRGYREDRQRGDLRPRRLQMYRSDGELRQEPQEQKDCPPDLVGTVAGELDPGLSQGVQLQREVEPGPLHSQAAAAKKAGMTFQQWNDVESGRTGAKRGIAWPTLEKVAKAVGVSAVELLKGSPAKGKSRKR